MEVEASGDGVTLRRVGAEPSLIRKKGILVHHGGARVAVDIVEFIRAEREARSARRGAVTSSRLSYDGLHVRCGRKAAVDRILTYDVTHFERFDLAGIEVMAP